MYNSCLKCWKEKNKNSRKKPLLSNDLGVCEVCGKWKRIVMPPDAYYGEYDIVENHIAFLWFQILRELMYFIWRRIQWIYHYISEHKKM